ncbi:MAG: hypothetical protein ABL929_01070 [Ferruginibacter sp.]|nr:hypothetical protein [Ferruginibacter sp.]
MENIQSYITASCAIKNGKVFKNEKIIFENIEDTLSSFFVSIYKNFEMQYPKFYKMDMLSKLGWLAAEILLKNNFDTQKYKADEVAIILANTNASIDTDTKYFETIKDIASPALFVYTLPNIVIGEISIKHNFKGENAFFISEKFDPIFLKNYVQNLIINNNLQACICGWVELVKEDYNATLFLIEKEQNNIKFTAENLNKIYAL